MTLEADVRARIFRRHVALNSPAPAALALLGAIEMSCSLPKLEVDPNYKESGGTGTSGTTAAVTATGGSSVVATDSSGGTTTAPLTTVNTNGHGGSVASGGSKNSGGTTSNGGTKSIGGTSPVAGGTKSGGNNSTAGVKSGGTTSVAGNASGGGSGGGSNGGSTSAGGGAAAAGSGSTSVAPACLGNPIPIPTNGIISADSNGCGINGSWYWHKDHPASGSTLETTVTDPASASATPVVTAGGKACLKGSTVVDAAFNAWGAVIGFSFNGSSGVTQTYDAAAKGIGGFEITVTGTFPQGLRAQFPSASTGTNLAVPFVPISAPGTYRIRFADAFVPMQWSNTNAGAGVDPRQLTTFELDVAGGSVAGAFDFCVQSVIPLPIDDDGALGNRPVSFVQLPLDAANIVTSSSNKAGIQGYYYCAAPAGATVTCGSTTGTNSPYRSNVNATGNGGACVSGTMTTSADNWGALVGLNLNQPVNSTDRLAYDAAANKVRGFRIDTTNTTAGLPLRIQIGSTQMPENGEVVPFEEFAVPGIHLVDLGSISCPNWSGVSCSAPNPNQIFFVEANLATLKAVKAFDVCLMKIEAMIER